MRVSRDMPRGISRFDEARLQGRLRRPARGTLSYWIEPPQSYLTDVDATNLLASSEDFSASWTASGVASVATNTTVAPTGAATADTLSASGAGAEATLRGTVTLVSSVVYTFSCYAKPNTGFFRLRAPGGFGVDDHTVFDLINQRITYLNAAFTAGLTYIGAGWYRCAVCYGPATGTGGLFDLGVNSSGSGSGASGGESVFIWGAQVAPGRSETLYRPTSGGAIIGAEPTWREDRAMAAVAGQSSPYGTRLAASNPFKNRPPLIGD